MTMTTRHTSRLVVGAASLILVVLVFSGFITSAAPADRTPPTTPLNLVVIARTETTITVAWNPSTDNSGRFSYKLRINNLSNSAYNSLATVTQSQTTYTARFLSPDSPHSFSVFATDNSGNRSRDSNVVNVRTMADVTPPTAPTLVTTPLAPSQVELNWTRSMDNVRNHCCSYGITVNGIRVTENVNWVGGEPNTLTAVLRHLAPATNYNVSISVWDWTGGNIATSNGTSVTTEGSTDTMAPSAPGNLRLLRNHGCGEITLTWDQATDDKDAQSSIEYEIYVNGVVSPLPVSAGVNNDFVYATISGDNTFFVRAVDRSGNTSLPSNMITLRAWPC
jgi:hypothetical protein